MKKLLQLTLSLLIVTGTGLISCADSENYTTSETDNKVLLVSMDGFMNEYLDRNETPNFDRFIAGGVKAEHMIPVFPTKTFPTHWTIATGLYTENHGVIANSFPDPNLDGYFSYGPQDSPNDERWWQGEPIWITAENQGLTSALMFWPGSEASINGVHASHYKDYDGSVPNASRIDTVVSWLDPAGEVDADFSTLYFSHVDSRGHSYGPNSPEVDEAVVNADSLLGYLLDEIEAKGFSDRLNILLTSDHGMAELSEDKVIFLDDMINLDDVEVVDWSPVAMLRPEEGKIEKVYNALKEGEENYTVYYRDELPREYRFSNHERIPEIIMIADIPYSITTHSNFEERGIITGTHGFDHRSAEMATIFFATGPAIKADKEIAPFESVHLYELMARLLNVEPSENDGDLNVLRHILK